MADNVIELENVSKQYRLGAFRTSSLVEDVNEWWAKLRGRPSSRLKVTETNDRASRGVSDLVWALQGISFEIRRGEVIGIIGQNGAGKSTLLKILSRVTAPTSGELRVKGRIASLLEVGTGFHTELTGRENIFLNGAILGMTRNDIRARFDEIVEFSGCARYIDTPVKRYSSGMMVRLGFAVAAHLEPEILIVDEVLAVGDAEFQKKCLGKMQDVTRQDRTVLFVSHNMATMRQLCERGILLRQGRLAKDGPIEEVVKSYLAQNVSSSTTFQFSREQHRIHSPLQITKLELLPPDGRTMFLYGEPICIRLTIECSEPVDGARIGIGLLSEGVRICTIHSPPLDFGRDGVIRSLLCTIPGETLLPGHFAFVLGAHIGRNGQPLDHIGSQVPIQISEVSADGLAAHDVRTLGLMHLEADWESKRIL